MSTNADVFIGGDKRNARLLIVISLIGTILFGACTNHKSSTPNDTDIYMATSQKERKQRLDKWHTTYTAPKPSSKADSIANAKKFGKSLKIALKYDCSIEDAERLQQGKIWLGMTYKMLTYLRGNADHINVSNYGRGNEYQACWMDYTPRCVYFKSSGEITAYN